MRVYTTGEESPGKETDEGEEVARFSVLYAKASARKHKKWENDGVLICYARNAVLKTEDENTVISRSTSVKRIDDLQDGFVLKMGSLEVQIQERLESSTGQVKRPPPQPTQSLKRPAMAPLQMPSLKKRQSGGFVCPLPGFQPADKGCADFIINEKEVAEGGAPVAVPAMFTRHLRPHQREGAAFIYSRLSKGGGAILADEMGLGKSVQTLCATWALVDSKRPANQSVKKCLLIVPSSLVNNWKAEFRKWFAARRSPVIDVKKSVDIVTYMRSHKFCPYLLISYDMATRCREQLAVAHFDVLVCDEGHRLKNLSGKLRETLDGLGISRRLLLTGTPIQNDMEELFSLLDFTRPGDFGAVAQFRKMCSDNSSQLSSRLDETMLRRTGEIYQKHLPDKHEYVVFCRPSPIQKPVYSRLCDHMTGEPLVIIDLMKKLCNHPAILYKKMSEKYSEDPSFKRVFAAFPKDYGERPALIKDSGKLSVLSEMLSSFRALRECTVVVSSYTKTLDMIAGLSSSLGLRVLRLDGSTPVNERQSLVNRFNNDRNPENVFLLSTKAGGVGLNLIAASRLVLFDSDWNPALDLQAMARIWRDGQTRPCHIFRLCTAGTIDEKILQRQVKKTALSSVLSASYEACSGNVKFRDEDLMDIFTPVDAECNTHDMLECDCGGNGLLRNEVEDGDADDDGSLETPPEEDVDQLHETHETVEPASEENEDSEPSGPASMAELFRWRHFSPSNETQWSLFLSTSGMKPSPTVSFAFHLTSQY